MQHSLIGQKPMWFVEDGAEPAADPSHGMYLSGIRCLSGPGGKPGLCYGDAYTEDPETWRELVPGVWHRLVGLPQAYLRLRQHPLVRTHREVLIPTCPEGRWWVPVLLRPLDEADPGSGLVSALDRVVTFREEDPLSGQDLDALMRQLAELAHGIPLADDGAARTLAAARLAVRALQVTHHISEREIAAAGWMTEATVLRVLWAAIGMQGDAFADAADLPIEVPATRQPMTNHTCIPGFQSMKNWA